MRQGEQGASGLQNVAEGCHDQHRIGVKTRILESFQAKASFNSFSYPWSIDSSPSESSLSSLSVERSLELE
jgi:hypothetical protein